jgi:creatinine amidohydrolase
VERVVEMTWREAAAAARDPRAVVLLPVGAVEQHGPHLPLLVDWLGAEEIARRLAPRLRRAGWRPVLAPGLPYGVSTLAERWSGTVSLSIPTFARLVVEIVRGLARHGFRRVVLANYQADPEHLAGIAAVRRALARAGVQVLVAGFSPDASEHAHMVDPRVRAMMRSPRPDGEWHSGELETALVLATRPRLVRRAIAARLRPNWVDFRGPLARGARRFEALGADGQGYFGWPRTARAETGEKVIALRVRLIGEHLAARLAAWRPRRPVTRGGRGAASSPRRRPSPSRR